MSRALSRFRIAVLHTPVLQHQSSILVVNSEHEGVASAWRTKYNQRTVFLPQSKFGSLAQAATGHMQPPEHVVCQQASIAQDYDNLHPNMPCTCCCLTALL